MITTDIWMDFLIDDKGKYWFINGEGEALFYIDKKTCVTHFVSCMPNERKRRLYNSGLKYKDELWFMPFYAKHILIYNISMNIFERIELSELYKTNAQFSLCKKSDNIAYVVATNLEHLLLKINLDTKEVYQISFAKYLDKKDILSRDAVLKNGKLFLTVINQPMILMVDLIDNSIKKYIVLGTKYGFGTIVEKEQKFILTNPEGVFEWEICTESAKKIMQYPQNVECNNTKKIIKFGEQIEGLNGKQPFWNSFICNGEILLISAFVDCSLLINPVTGELRAIDLDEEDNEMSLQTLPLNRRITSLKHLFSQQFQDDILCFLTKRNSILKISAKQCFEPYSEFQIVMCLTEYYDWLIQSNAMLNETNNFR